MTDFAIEFGPVVPVVREVQSPRVDGGAPHDGDHEWHEVIYLNLHARPTPDRDYAACGCGQMAKRDAAGVRAD